MQSYDWTIKVDPDPVLIPWRILEPAYLPCSSFQSGKLAHSRTYPAWRCLQSGYFTPEAKQDNSQDGKGAVAVVYKGMGALRSRTMALLWQDYVATTPIEDMEEARGECPAGCGAPAGRDAPPRGRCPVAAADGL